MFKVTCRELLDWSTNEEALPSDFFDRMRASLTLDEVMDLEAAITCDRKRRRMDAPMKPRYVSADWVISHLHSLYKLWKGVFQKPEDYAPPIEMECVCDGECESRRSFDEAIELQWQNAYMTTIPQLIRRA